MYLFTRSPRDHVFLFTAHHIVGDFWSFVVLMEEMRTTYPAALAGKPPALPPLNSDYRQFVRWQTNRLAGSEGDRLWGWWKNHLNGVPHVLELPTDRPRPHRFTHRGGSVPCRLDAGLTARLKKLAAKEEVTLFVSLLACFQAFLSRYSGQTDFVVGSPFAGRPRREFEGVVGYFINMLPCEPGLPTTHRSKRVTAPVGQRDSSRRFRVPGFSVLADSRATRNRTRPAPNATHPGILHTGESSPGGRGWCQPVSASPG